MANETRLNHLVKGTAPPAINPPPPAPLPHLSSSSTQSTQSTQSTPEPHLSTLPSAPPQIYLNLLILESSLRAQYLHLLSRRRLNTFFLLLLSLWNFLFIYALFLRPREDGIGHGGSVYWVVETSEKLALMGGSVTALFIWATGQWERGMRWPRRWIGTTNRGLRGFNLRVVIVRGKWYREMLGHMSFLLPFGLWTEAGGSDWHLVEHETGAIVEEDLARGGDHIMLLLLPKSFSPEFRENWEGYRSEYWGKENDRRATLRRKLKTQRIARARDIGGWKWWTGVWRLIPHHRPRRQHDLEKHPQGHHHHHGHARHNTLSEKDTLNFKASRRRSLLRSDSANNSRQSSRSSTPALPDFDGTFEKLGTGPTERVRRGSSVSSTASVRRKTRAGTGAGTLTMTTRREREKGRESPPGTPGLEGAEGFGLGLSRERERERDRLGGAA